MATDADGTEDRMTKINVRVPAELLEQIDAAYAERGYSSRSEAIRDALRDWVDPGLELTPETVEALTASRRERDAGQTLDPDEVRDRLDLDDG